MSLLEQMGFIKPAKPQSQRQLTWMGRLFIGSLSLLGILIFVPLLIAVVAITWAFFSSLF